MGITLPQRLTTLFPLSEQCPPQTTIETGRRRGSASFSEMEQVVEAGVYSYSLRYYLGILIIILCCHHLAAAVNEDDQLKKVMTTPKILLLNRLV